MFTWARAPQRSETLVEWCSAPNVYILTTVVVVLIFRTNTAFGDDAINTAARAVDRRRWSIVNRERYTNSGREPLRLFWSTRRFRAEQLPRFTRFTAPPTRVAVNLRSPADKTAAGRACYRVGTARSGLSAVRRWVLHVLRSLTGTANACARNNRRCFLTKPFSTRFLTMHSTSAVVFGERLAIDRGLAASAVVCTNAVTSECECAWQGPRVQYNVRHRSREQLANAA